MANNQSAYPVNSKVHSSRQILQRPQLSNVQIYTKNLSGVAYSPDRSQSSLGMVSPDRLERVMQEVQMVGQQQNHQTNYLPNRAGSVIGSYSSAYGSGPSSQGVNHFTTPISADSELPTPIWESNSGSSELGVENGVENLKELNSSTPEESKI